MYPVHCFYNIDVNLQCTDYSQHQLKLRSAGDAQAYPGIALEDVGTSLIDRIFQKGFMLTIMVRFSEEFSLRFSIVWVSKFSEDAEHF